MLLPFSSNISQRISFSGLNCLIVYAQCGNGHIPRAYVNSTSCLALHKMGVEHQRTSIYIRACSLQEQICEVQVSLTDMYHTTYFVVEVVPLWYDTHPLLVSIKKPVRILGKVITLTVKTMLKMYTFSDNKHFVWPRY